MARFGRGQPHPPIFLRAPLVAAIVATIASPIHVIQTDSHRPSPTHVYYVRPSRSSLVPDRLAPQSHIVLTTSTRHAGREVDVVVLRNPLAPAAVPDRVLQQSHVVLTFSARHPARDSDVVVLRNPIVPVAAPSAGAPKPRVIQAQPGPRRLGFIQVTPAWGADFIPDRLPTQIHVLLQDHRIPKTQVVVLRNALVPPAAPTRLAPQSHVVLQEQRPAKTHVVVVRNALVPPATPARLAPQVHVISQVASRLRAVRAPLIVLLQGGLPPVTVFALPLQIEDRSGFLVALLDQSTKRYLVGEQSAVKLSTEDT